MSRMPFTLGLILLSAPAFAGTNDNAKPLQVVPSVDLHRYTGKWFEIARLPNWFQKDCVGDVTAAYSMLDESRLRVVNACRKSSGRVEQADGIARLADRQGPNSKLKVRFAPAWLSWLPFVWGDYWIVAIAPDYSYSLVGTPDRKYLWVLSRTARMEETTYGKLIEKAAAAGFDVTRIIKTKQAHAPFIDGGDAWRDAHAQGRSRR